MTNSDRIRQMTDEEYAEYFGDFICECQTVAACKRFKTCIECKLSWLKEERIGVIDNEKND